MSCTLSNFDVFDSEIKSIILQMTQQQITLDEFDKKIENVINRINELLLVLQKK